MKNAPGGRPRHAHGTKAAFERHRREHTPVCDACAAWRLGDDTDTPVAPIRRAPLPVDPVANTLDDLRLIDEAIRRTKKTFPERLAPLSKRRSELLKELIEYGGAKIEKPADADPLDAMLGDVTSITIRGENSSG